jgi:hypothetical protein
MLSINVSVHTFLVLLDKEKEMEEGALREKEDKYRSG